MSILFSKAKAGQCRWIVCDAVAPAPTRRSGVMPDLFGGRRVCGRAVSGATSYCLGHRLVVYAPVEKTPAPALDFTVVRRAPEPETQPELTEIFG
ncbi:hypothetical protein [Bosea minatitlanensis]|uniref:Uncharacterized protein n=1 Tax=Bosea minatitlanensis TaxID=128782 RepID=A0ABW0F264_9HYPH|nr:hypothetical protein [Bosea minatitlanensis]MCT4491777.1 hypothetical protein [Bosea minatitlanensis]